MLNYYYPNLIFILVLIFYFLPLIIGFYLGNKKLVNTSNISEIGKNFTDPLTKKFIICQENIRCHALRIKNGCYYSF